MVTKKRTTTDKVSNNSNKRFDDWENLINSLKNPYMDNYKFKPKKRLTRNLAEALYADNKMIANIIDFPIGDMLSEWITITGQDSQAFYELHDKWNTNLLLEEALTYEGIHGGSAIVIDVQDKFYNSVTAKDFSYMKYPLDITTIKDINCFYVVDRWILQPVNYTNALKDPELYTLSLPDGGQLQIHSSRLIRFKGINSGLTNRHLNNSWGESIIYGIQDVVKRYDVVHELVPEIIKQFVTNIYKFKGMNSKINTPDEEKIKKKVSYLEQFRNVSGAIVTDLEDDFIPKQLNIGGLKDGVNITERNLCAIAGQPHTKLLQESPGSTLSNSGRTNAQDKQYNKTIKKKQVFKLNDPFNTLHAIFATILKKEIPRWFFNPLEREDRIDIITNRNLQAQTDSIYTNELKVDPSFILKLRATENGYMNEMIFTEEELKQIDKLAKERDALLISQNLINTTNQNMNKNNMKNKGKKPSDKMLGSDQGMNG